MRKNISKGTQKCQICFHITCVSQTIYIIDDVLDNLFLFGEYLFISI